MKSRQNTGPLLEKAFATFRTNPPDLRQLGDKEGEIRYVESTLPSYYRTVTDILDLYPNRDNLQGLCFVELGAFLGIVSKALSLASAKIIACDIPEFFDRDNVKEFYRKMGIETKSFNLRDYKLPFESSSQDCVIACETFEHLNFNPLPIFAEINRILKPGGLFYIAMPNGAYLTKRIKYLFSGKTPGFTVEQLYAQFDPNINMVVGLHWKEYSVNQTVEMLTPLGFEVLKSKVLNDTASGDRTWKQKFTKFLIPGGDTQILVFKKVTEFDGKFAVCADS